MFWWCTNLLHLKVVQWSGDARVTMLSAIPLKSGAVEHDAILHRKYCACIHTHMKLFKANVGILWKQKFKLANLG